MATRRKITSDESVQHPPRTRPGTTPEARENQMIALAIDTAERQMRDGTASSQVITHFLKLGSSTEKLQKEKLAMEREVLAAKVEAMESQKRIEELYGEALNAMKSYAGQQPAELEMGLDDD